jgi:hypothetical protein
MSETLAFIDSLRHGNLVFNGCKRPKNCDQSVSSLNNIWTSLRDFNAELCRKDVFKPTIWNKNVHEINNDNMVIVVNFATTKNVIVTSSMISHRNTHKFTWRSPDGKSYKDHVLIYGRLHLILLDVQSYRGANFCTDWYLFVEGVRERLAVNHR